MVQGAGALSSGPFHLSVFFFLPSGLKVITIAALLMVKISQM